ncbi:hypothetical protein PoB_006069900 [Plakobranchus ocellatus]|uniref:Uncharacterized protein n=1 Tax=Plakobranchus ocellatus TaxID=259542 RepID=A0AAV4CQP8_9GAST|nr:hypothetical protein PoB_006069900 [Plakobranchus ocellatus]
MLLKFARTHKGPIGKKMFPKMLKQPSEREESFRPHTVLAGFSSAGTSPFNSQAVAINARPQSSQPSQITIPEMKEKDCSDPQGPGKRQHSGTICAKCHKGLHGVCMAQ